MCDRGEKSEKCSLYPASDESPAQTNLQLNENGKPCMRRENTQNTFKWYWRPLRSTGNFKKLILETEGTNTGENGGKGEWTEETHT